MIADYERRNFSVSQAKWDASSSQNLVAILPPSNSSTSSKPISRRHRLPVAAVAGGAAGAVVLLVTLYLLFILWSRKSRPGVVEVDSTPSLSHQELDAGESHHVDADGKYIPVEIDPYGRKWPPAKDAIEMGDNGGKQEVYEMPAEEVALEAAEGRPLSWRRGEERLGVGTREESERWRFQGQEVSPVSEKGR